VNFLPKTATGRITLAIVLSLMAHAVLVFGPKLVELPPAKPLLPPLIAKLEPLPKVVVKSVPPKPKPKPHRPKPAAVPKTVKHAEPVPATPEVLAIAATEAPAALPAGDSQSEPASAAEPAETTQTAGEGQAAHPLPKHAQLTFLIHKGTGFPVGQAHHELNISDDQHYTLQTSINTIGLVSIFKTFEMNQHSSGTIDAQGLHPDEFSEGKVNDKGKQVLTAKFDWQNKQLAFSSGDTVALPEQTQDMLSFLYQLSQSTLTQPVLTMNISNGKKLEKYQLAVGQEDYILTRNGKMRTLPLRKIHAPGEEGLEVWLALEYRLLPVKIRQIDRNGEIAGEMVISDIRVSDE